MPPIEARRASRALSAKYAAEKAAEHFHLRAPLMAVAEARCFPTLKRRRRRRRAAAHAFTSPIAPMLPLPEAPSSEHCAAAARARAASCR